MDYRRHMILAAALLPGMLIAQASQQAASAPGWLIEKPYAEQPMPGARIAGIASYNAFQGNATLALRCYKNGAIRAELVIDPKQLGFDSDPYEGPDATAHGPVTTSIGNNPPIGHSVSGWFGDGGPFNVGTPFLFGFALTKAESQQWAAAQPGQSLRIVVPSAAGKSKLTAEFRWPEDNAPFKQVVTPCLGKIAGA